MKHRYTVFYRERKHFPKAVHQKSFSFAAEATKWLDSRCDEILIVAIQRHDEVTLDEMLDEAWSEFGERSS